MRISFVKNVYKYKLKISFKTIISYKKKINIAGLIPIFFYIVYIQNIFNGWITKLNLTPR